MTIQPRNSLVLVKLFPRKDDIVGQIMVPSANDQYTEGKVVAIGPGSIAAAGGQSETFDLQIGHRVWIKYKERGRGPTGPMLMNAGLLLRDGESEFYLFEQSSIVAILS